LMKEKLISSETSVLTTRRKIPEDGILHSYRNENLKSYEIRYCSMSRANIPEFYCDNTQINFYDVSANIRIMTQE
jgi:hypothetical protein